MVCHPTLKASLHLCLLLFQISMIFQKIINMWVFKNTFIFPEFLCISLKPRLVSFAISKLIKNDNIKII